jgi:predicted transposase YbfD/YdcC
MDPTILTVCPQGYEQSVTIDISALYAQFARVPDQRKRRGTRYPLAVLLTVAVLAKLAGASQPRALADWARERAGELAAWLGLKGATMPHPTTWSRVFGNGVAVEAVEVATQHLLSPPPGSEVPPPASTHIALDGKTLRGTIPAGCTTGVHLLAAYDVAQGVVVRQLPVAAKANEIVAAPALVRGMPLRGVIVTGDAMFAQRDLSIRIKEGGGDYLWIVKENQPTLYDDLQLLFSPTVAVAPGWSPIPLDFVTLRQVEKGHGRLEERQLTVSSLLAGYHDWPYLAQAFQLVRQVWRGKKHTHEVRYGITSATTSEANAQRIFAVIRGHWAIENGLHYRRDVTLREDASQIRMGHAPQVLASLNNLVCGVTARAGITNLAAFQRSAAAAIDRLLFRR